MEHLYIIADTDSCDQCRPDLCEVCPLAKLKKRSDGSYMSCIAAVGYKSPGDGTYAKAAALQILELMIGEDSEKNK